MHEGVKQAIRLMAQSLGVDPELAYNDSIPVQYVVKAVPA